MSTRVHELAKDLNIKSQVILDFLKAEGLLTKASVLASLESDQIEKIRHHFGKEPAQADEVAAKQAPSQPKAAEPRTQEPVSPTEIEPDTSRKQGDKPVAAKTDLKAPPAASPSPSAEVKPVTSIPTSQMPRSAPPSGPATVRPPQPPRDLGRPPVEGQRPPQQPGQSFAPGRGPVRPGTAPPQGGGKSPQLSSGLHRTHQPPLAPKAPAPRDPRSESATEQAPQAMPDRPVVQAQPTMPAGPLKRGDYIDPSGVRRSFSPGPGTAASQRPPATSQTPPPDRKPITPRPNTPNVPQFRPSATGTGQPKGPAPLRDHFGNRGGNRPPSGGSPTGQAPQGRGPAPGQSQGGYTRPDRKFSPDELKKMMESGQIKPISSPTKPTGPITNRPATTGTLGQRPPGVQSIAPQGSMGLPGTSPPVGLPSVIDEEEERRKNGKGGNVNERAARREQRTSRQTSRVTSPVSVDSLIGADDDESMHRRSRRPKHKSQQVIQQTRKDFAELEPPVNVRSLSEAIGVKANEIMTLLFKQGKAVRINDALPEQTAMELALEFGVELKIVHERTAEDDMLDIFIDQTEEGEKETRPPIITILGHVDHGKTSLLDRIRKSDVAAHESGGITQHIGAYQVSHNGHQITFLDTPGHEAFTSMRARGANVTDIVVLVVAADDGVMPQTEEAISHAKAAEVPIIVALNKIDLPTDNINRIFGELSQHGLVPEEYGGDTLVVKTSAHTGLGIPDLLENLLLIAELKDLKGNKNRPAVGTCLEAQVSEGRGVVATMLVEDGTLKVGDVVVCGNGYGRVRAMYNHRGESIEAAGPSMPVEVSGLDEVPVAGEKFAVLPDLSKAREIAGARKERSRELERSERSAVTLENLFDRMKEQRVRSLNIILKADVQGSLEALTKELEKLENAEIPIRILHRAVGGITESDVQLADASQAIIIGFRVAPEDRAISMADDKNIDIRRYDIIYQVTDEVKKAIEGMLVPEIKVVHLGRAAVRQVFKISKIGTVAGCFVTSGTIERTAKVRLVRDGREIYKGSLEALKRFKDDVREVREGFECGIRISNYDDVKVDDIIEAFKIEEIRRTL